jgi:hypothetical protein
VCRQRSRWSFDKVAELGGARQALLWFHEHGLICPHGKTTAMSPGADPRYATIHRMIDNPIYGGATTSSLPRGTPGIHA